LGFWGSKVPQNGRFPDWDTDEPPAKYDITSFILGKEIRNRTKNKQTHNQ